MPDAYLALADGRVFEARSRAPGRSRGELVFTTAYTGYEESLTDPSYEEQVLTFSYPLIGNYGVRADRFESDRVHPRAAIAREFTDDVAAWLASEGVPAIDHIDTRELVTTVREAGAMRCGIAAGREASPEDARLELENAPEMSDHTNIGAQVSISKTETKYGGGVADVALVDCGVKQSIIDALVERGADVHVFPHDVDESAIATVDPDVLFLSNGPGDPANFEKAESLVETFTGEVPIAGICLGQQIIARANGGSTRKMTYGHRGVNQPVLDLRTDTVVMTTQNHGYAVDDVGDLEATQINVNDDTVEGLECSERNVLTRQYHPEANPGPNDTLGFFDDVLEMADNRISIAAD